MIEPHPFRVVVIDSDPRYRRSLEQLVSGAADCSIAASFPSVGCALQRVDLAVRRAEELPWDLVLMELESSQSDGVEAVRALKLLLPRLPIVVLTVFEQPATVRLAIRAGADGYMLKTMRAREILDGLRVVNRGGAPLAASIARSVLELMRRDGRPIDARQAYHAELTGREHQVLRSLVDGLSYKQTAATLRISLGTVRTHVTAAYRKLEVHSVAEAVSRAIREGIV